VAFGDDFEHPLAALGQPRASLAAQTLGVGEDGMDAAVVVVIVPRKGGGEGGRRFLGAGHGRSGRLFRRRCRQQN